MFTRDGGGTWTSEEYLEEGAECVLSRYLPVELSGALLLVLQQTDQ